MKDDRMDSAEKLFGYCSTARRVEEERPPWCQQRRKEHRLASMHEATKHARLASMGLEPLDIDMEYILYM